MAENQKNIDKVSKFFRTRLGRLLTSNIAVNTAHDLSDAGVSRSEIQSLLSTGSGTKKDPNLAHYYSEVKARQ